jgi:CDP-glucose 4,6-dehydratase
VYGGGDLNWSRIVPGTIRSLVRAERPVLRSDGTFVRDYLHVDDVVDAYLALADWLDSVDAPGLDASGVAFNFSAEAPLTVTAIYRAVCDACGEHVDPVVLADAVGEIHDQYLDASRAHTQLGWKAQVELADGMARTVAWYRALFADR